jgi:biopolymer transport protein ExbB
MKLLSFVLVCIFACTAFGSGLIAEYKFDDSLIDTGSDGNSTDNLSGAAFYHAGISGAALYCDANSFIASDSTDLDLPAQYTIEAFIKPHSISGIQYILSKGCYKLFMSDANLAFSHTQSDGSIISGISASVLTLNRWQHIVLTADGSRLTLYVNGKAALILLYDGTILNSSASLSIGNYSYHGLIDEVRIFGSAKTSAYIYSRAFYDCGDLQKEDIDRDCRISIEDFFILTEQWLLTE